MVIFRFLCIKADQIHTKKYEKNTTKITARLINTSKFTYLMVRFYTYLGLYLDDMTKKVSLSEFEKYFKIPHQTIKKHLEQFTKAKILIEEKKERFLFYKLSLENPLTKEYLILCEKERLLNFLEKKTIFLQLYRELSEFFNDAPMLIFGSAVHSNNFSDVDLLILSDNKGITAAIKKFSQTYSIKIHGVQTTEKDMTKSFIREIRQKHIVLNSHEYFMEVLYQ